MSYCQPHAIYLKDYVVSDYLINQVELEIQLDEVYTIVKSILTIQVNPESEHPSKELILVGDALELESITLAGKKLSPDQYSVTPEKLIVFNVPSEFKLEIVTHIKPQENTALSGLYKSSGNYCTQCEAEGFRRITYYLDRPDVMARFTTKIIADAKSYPILLSNGNLIEQGLLDDGKHWVRWEDPFKKPCYLFALVAGDLDFIEDHFVTQSGRRVLLRIYVERGNKDKCDHAMQAVKKAMRWDEEKFGREYDLDIYMIVAVSDFNMGAMENKGLNIFNTKYILAKSETATDEDFVHVESVIAHEYFHNWTGNRITCRDWFQLSLKEGLTIFRDQSFTADTTSRSVARIQDVIALRAQQFPEDNGPLAHAVRPESYIEINNFYTATIYNKGAEVIRMMKTIIGEQAFRKGMDLYFTRHDGQAVTINDFAQAMQDASGVDLTQFKLWYSQAGTPVLEIKDEYDATQKKYRLTIRQSCPATPNQPDKKPFYIPIKFGLMDKQGKEFSLPDSVLHLKKPEEVFEFSDISSHPVPSLLREFSAPVKMKFKLSDESLQLLFKHDSDGFNRWEAGQQYAVNVLLKLINDVQLGKTLQVPAGYLEAFQHVLNQQLDDKWLLAEMLTLPSMKYIADQMDVVDVDAIYLAREFLLSEIASFNQDIFQKLYLENQDNIDLAFSIEETGKRQLKNISLFYMMYLTGGNDSVELCFNQFNASLTKNMSNTMGALRCLTNSESPLREQAFAQFYKTWKENPLVMDKWFSLQAVSKLPDTLNQVKNLLTHPAFDIKNPNKVYALIGAFGQQNVLHFHAADGSGYEFLASVVQQLDALNPQVAARMVRPLTEWKRYDKMRGDLMVQQLKNILDNKKLSNDVYELVSKSL
ncbi:MAG: aminopeptidase N [Gammaproteobacteria bacterium]|nr:aminopeptidase N [Gammaproteobacteria bacterium]